MIIADTDVLIDYLRGRNPMASRIEVELQSRGFFTTAVTAFELWTGARSHRQTSAVALLLDAIPILPLDAEAARIGADARNELLSRGQDIGMADSLIAGICLRERGTLLTGSHRHFSRVPGLKLSPATPDEDHAE